MIALQFALNGLIAGSLVALTAVSFVIVYRSAGFFNFAHAGLITAGAYSFLFLRVSVSFPLFFAGALFWLAPAVMGSLLERVVHEPLRRRRATSAGLLLASLGSYTLIQNLLAICFGDETLSFRWWSIQEGWRLGSLRITPTQVAIATQAWLLIIFTWLLLRMSDTGRTIRALAVSPSLAEVIGLDIRRARVVAAFLGSGLAGISGFLVACDVDMNPTMGLQPLMTAVVAALVSRCHLIGSAFVALALSLLQNVLLIWLPSGWQDTLVFLALLGFFLFRSPDEEPLGA